MSSFRDDGSTGCAMLASKMAERRHRRRQETGMGRLTTHVLDTAHGVPGGGMRVILWRVAGSRQQMADVTTNADGRCDRPLLDGATFVAGTYELDFHAGDYFAARGIALPQPRFLDVVTLRFGVSDPAQHYHVPLLVSPFAYSTYRGS
ncbi:hydroxyisourate hydrolase [Dongia rigui]|uniref:5-hydroxyisourate hydrolase n=2 Tax=Dongia rigui TaxID=940149 RepID=A0ABU5DUV2_9PROT|nr:hydroxyisourate hydrolase [Dongia rigui]MDY0871074.1 hydroxyisourate hydrolase [Dongia rigui]